MAVVECALANLLFHFEWEIPKEMKEEVIDMTEAPGITAQKKTNLILIAKSHVSFD
ncbi:Cytochrome P450 71B34 [Apostasia shenzhenica]|uniref:Cytochrome P450 71B34 n=1 Tax=Apostasia shenzhenica TaxID=1088818 RepID=A0A2H9ZY21_9ASPA|nr:Cytochrome P450 71B34 [Apostasia shenzhenica]